MQHITDRYRDSSEYLREPHQEPCYKKHEAAANDLPELQLLASVEEADILGLESLFSAYINLQAADPLAVRGGPPH